jgi:perosamine synthetase
MTELDAVRVEAQLLGALRAVAGEIRGQPIPLHAPEFAGNEWTYLKECLDTGWVSSAGRFVDRFEQQLAEFTGAHHAVAVANGTAALHVALHLAGIGPGDEVIVPALTFVATANAVAHCGAVPHFVDSEQTSLSMDAVALERWLDEMAEPGRNGPVNRVTRRRIGAIVPMHTFGHPADLDALVAVAARHGLPLVEDAAESLGSRYHGRHTGTFGVLGTLSFNGNKIVTTGGGGAILTADPALAARAKHLTTTGKRSHPWEFFHDETAWNLRLPNINAALGCAQLERLPDMLARKRRLAARYRDIFAPLSWARFVEEPPETESNYWLNVIRVDGADLPFRNRLLAVVNDAGYQCRPAWTLLNRLPMYRSCPAAPLPVAERLEAELINLPSSAVLAPPA